MPAFTHVLTPLDPLSKLVLDMGEPSSDPNTYRRLIGKLNFLRYTRPDISFSVPHLSQFLQNPQVPHIQAALHVLRYLLNDLAQGILLSNSSDFSLLGYSNSDWAACAVLSLANMYLVSISFLVAVLFHGKERSNLLYPYLQLKLSTGP